MSTAAEPANPTLVEKFVQVMSYDRDDPKPRYGGADVVPIDWKAAMQDMATRIDTLQKSGSKVIVRVDESRIFLVTSTMVEAPPPPKEAPKPELSGASTIDLLTAVGQRLGVSVSPAKPA